MKMKMTSSAFDMGETIPDKYTCDGENVSPPLAWSEVPPETQSLIIIVDDPHASNGMWTHWIVYNIPSGIDNLPVNFRDSLLALQGRNSYQNIGYDGPCPPGNSTHVYHFRLFALNQLLELPANPTREQVLEQMQGRVIANTELTGAYTRQEAQAAH